MKKRVIAGIIIIVLLVVAYWYGGASDRMHGFTIADDNGITASETYASEAVAVARNGSEKTADDSSNAGAYDEKTVDEELSEKEPVVEETGEEAVEEKEFEEKKGNKKTDKKKKYTKKSGRNNSDKNKPNKNNSDMKTAGKKTEKKKKNTDVKSDNGIINSKQDNKNNNIMISANQESADNCQTPESDKENQDKTYVPDIREIGKTPAPKDTPLPKKNVVISEPSCKISISCEDIMRHIDMLEKGKKDILPDNGLILKETKVMIQKDDTVFDILKRVISENDIHMEYSYTPIYDCYYIEGIANIYEFDCGPLSGWLYIVNGKSPNVGCSQCRVEDGDEIEFRYTCDYQR